MIRRAAKRIKGITIELDGDATKLDKALEGINKDLGKTQNSLTDVNRLLKLDPKNTILLAQKQDLLTQAIEQTEEKLKVLENTQEQVTASFKSGDIGQEQYMAFQREVEATRSTLAKYKNDLSAMDSEQQRLAQNTQRLQKLMNALGQEVDDYADVLGTQLTNAIKYGTANSDQLRKAIEKIGRSAAGGKGDIKQLTEAIDTVDDGTAIKNLIDDLKKAGEAAQQTADDVGEIQKTIDDISHRMLSVTLRTLENDGMIERKAYAEIPPRVEYRLSPRGERLIPHLESLVEWALTEMDDILKERAEKQASR